LRHPARHVAFCGRAIQQGKIARCADYDKYRHDFAKIIWQLASPKWNFDDATFDRGAASFDNPDHVSIVIPNYRWRPGLAEGESKYDDLEKRLAEATVINVPTITLERRNCVLAWPRFDSPATRSEP
jgi:hypothetical protein